MHNLWWSMHPGRSKERLRTWYGIFPLWFTELWVTVHWLTMKTCRITYDNAWRTGVCNLPMSRRATSKIFGGHIILTWTGYLSNTKCFTPTCYFAQVINTEKIIRSHASTSSFHFSIDTTWNRLTSVNGCELMFTFQLHNRIVGTNNSLMPTEL